jgi:FkbM family methyltransferase
MPNIKKNLVFIGAHALGALNSLLDDNEAKSVASKLAAKKSSKALRAHAKWAHYFSRAFNNPSQLIANNGEAWLLEQTAGLDFKVMFDAGANIGNWFAVACRHHPKAVFHCFEIVPDTFNQLKKRATSTSCQVICNDFGLSNRPGKLPIHVDSDSHFLSTAYPTGEGEGAQIIECRVSTGDEYCREKGIEHIDMLKIDTEGAEGDVLIGFQRMLERNAIRLIQFEYNRSALASKFLLRDFYQLLLPRGYVLGRLYPTGVEFHDYHIEREDFVGPNYVACLSSDHEIINQLKID